MPSLTYCMEKAFGKQGTSAGDMAWGSQLEQHPQKQGLLVHSEETLQSRVATATASSAQSHFSPPILDLLLPGACSGPSPQNLEGQHLEKWVQKGETALQTSGLKMIELWMDLEMMRLRGVSQTEKDEYHMITSMWNLKRGTNGFTYKSETDSHTENKHRVTKGEGGGGIV